MEICKLKVGIFISDEERIEEKVAALAVEHLQKNQGFSNTILEVVTCSANNAVEVQRLLEEGVKHFFGSHEARVVLELLSKHNATLFMYSISEGFQDEQSVVYAGGTLSQYVLPMVNWIVSTGRCCRVVVLFDSTQFSRVCERIFRVVLEQSGCKVISNFEFTKTSKLVVDQIEHLNPDWIICCLTGNLARQFLLLWGSLEKPKPLCFVLDLDLNWVDFQRGAFYSITGINPAEVKNFQSLLTLRYGTVGKFSLHLLRLYSTLVDCCERLCEEDVQSNDCASEADTNQLAKVLPRILLWSDGEFSPVWESQNLFESDPWFMLDFSLHKSLIRGFLEDSRKNFSKEREVREETDYFLDELEMLSHTGHWRLDLCSGELYWSREVFRIFQVDEKLFDASYEAFLALIHPEDRQDVNNAYTESLKHRRPYNIVHRLLFPVSVSAIDYFLNHFFFFKKKKSGDVKHVRESCTTKFSEDGIPLVSMGTVQDITAETLRTQKLLELKNDAEQASRSKSTFLSVMSHELRTPLNGAIGMAYVLMETDLSSKQRDYVQSIISSCSSLVKSLSEILDASKLERGLKEACIIAFDLGKLIEETFSLYFGMASKKRLTLKLETDFGGFSSNVFGDPVLLGQILSNLLSNAIKFTDVGEVVLRVCLRRSDAVLFEVSDTGIGISPSQQKLIFLPFFQVETDPTKRAGGTGLGLSIVRSILEMMKSEIRVESELGKGSKFSFLLNVGPEMLKDVPAGMPPSKRFTSLLIDGDSANRLAFSTILEKLGISCKMCRNGIEAVNAADHNMFDIIFACKNIPIMGLKETILRFRNMRFRVPIIAFSHSEDEQFCISAGADGFLCSPIEECNLNQIIKQWLN